MALVACRGPDFVEVDSHHLVGVSERDVEIKFVLENVVVGCEIELGEFGIRYMELEGSGVKDEPSNDVGKENDENHGDSGFQKALEKAVTTAAATATALVGLVLWGY